MLWKCVVVRTLQCEGGETYLSVTDDDVRHVSANSYHYKARHWPLYVVVYMLSVTAGEIITATLSFGFKVA